MDKNWLARKHIVILGMALLAMILVAGCAQSAPTPAAGGAVEPVVVEKEVVREAVVEAPAAPQEGYTPQMAPSELGSLTERMIIRNADLALKVQDTQVTLAGIRDIAVALDGYVADTNLWRADDQLRGTVTIRVPSASFDAAMDQIKDLALEVEREVISGQDVTEEYTDLGARLRNLEATEKELLALLTEVREKTRKAEEVLAVHRELTAIRGEIEQIRGRMQYLERMTALATIKVELIPQEQKPIVEEGWQPGGTLRSALRALVNTGQFFVDAGIWVVFYILPVLLVLAAPVIVLVLVVRRWRRRRSARRASSASQEDAG